MKGFYINLNHRKDRMNHMEHLKQTYSFFSNVERMDAFQHKRGDIGCGLSHIKCFKKLKKENEAYYIILEDDFQILNHANFIDFERQFDKIKELNWDVIVLTPRGTNIQPHYYEHFHRINNNQTTSGYILKHHMLDIIDDLFTNGVRQLLKNNDPNIWSIDQVWKPIQNEKVFLYYKDVFGGQIPGFSDIENKIVDYNSRFLQQT
jgi:hypothetical protein